MMLTADNPASRTWQLLTVGPGSSRITPELYERLVRLLYLLPQTCLIEIEPDAGSISASPDWPSYRLEDVEAIESEIAPMPGIVRCILFQAAS